MCRSATPADLPDFVATAKRRATGGFVRVEDLESLAGTSPMSRAQMRVWDPRGGGDRFVAAPASRGVESPLIAPGWGGGGPY
jgi:hypothetical protein